MLKVYCSWLAYFKYFSLYASYTLLYHSLDFPRADAEPEEDNANQPRPEAERWEFASVSVFPHVELSRMDSADACSYNSQTPRNPIKNDLRKCSLDNLRMLYDSQKQRISLFLP